MQIRWTMLAARDFNNICDYTHEHIGVLAARRLALQIYESIGRLAQFPHSGRPGRKPHTRELVFTDTPFLAVYRVRGEAVEIARILHGAQKWP
jgi:plasmid stabilization system protein ParE